MSEPVRRVAITQRLVRNEAYPEERDALDVRWAPLLDQAGFALIPLPSGADPRRLLDGLGGLAGVILSGGNDLASVCDDPLSIRRDAFENRILEYTERNRIPVLGVCRGLQVLAVRHGMDLVRVAGHTATRHQLSAASGAGLLRRYDGLSVNSYHGFGLDGALDEGAVALRAADGTVEAIELPERRQVGIMWHPERETPFRQEDLALMREIFG